MLLKVLTPILFASLIVFSSCEDTTKKKENATKKETPPEKEIVLATYTNTEAIALHTDVLSFLEQSEVMFEELFYLDSIDASEQTIAAKADSALVVYNSFMIQMKETSETARPENESFIKSAGKTIYHFMTIAQVHKDYAHKLSITEDDWIDEDWSEWSGIVDPQYQDWIDAKDEFSAVLAEFETTYKIE